MEDSGIDSEDRQSNIYEDGAAGLLKTASGAPKHMSDLEFEVAFRGAGKVYAPTTIEIDEEEEATGGSGRGHEPPNTCRILQRKLELKVERARRNYTQFQGGAGEYRLLRRSRPLLIPFNRLPIPGAPEHKPLVDYKSESSDEAEEISFFPAQLKRSKRRQQNHELTDTFSIQEMTIDSDLESDDSAGTQNLELLLPSMKTTILDKFKVCFGCWRRR
ncbi:GM16293 [Drosophila sechellia]|uniref:GM16293 n=1 Tax=Drosophila sechellia TaxID=7238 RepID=B4IH11_DROSE|nr:GM16293 [Drosophila sechellia]